MILDLDLDYFNDSSKYNAFPKIREEEEIIKDLFYLKELMNWDVITVALSPEFCGGEKPCRYLFNLFLKVFNISKTDLIEW